MKVLFLLGTGKPQPPTKTSSKLKCLIFPRCGASRMKIYHWGNNWAPSTGKPRFWLACNHFHSNSSDAILCYIYNLLLISLPVQPRAQSSDRDILGVQWNSLWAGTRAKSTVVSAGMSMPFKHDIRSLLSISKLLQARKGSLNPLDLIFKIHIANFLSVSAEDCCTPLEYPQVRMSSWAFPTERTMGHWGKS